MSIVKRTQLGQQTRIRSDIVLEILVNDMKKMLENFSISLMAAVCQDGADERNSKHLKVIQERWKSNRRGHGHYTKAPEKMIMNNLKNVLIMPSTNVNADLIMPQLTVSHWLKISIELLLSIKVVREALPLSSSNTLLLDDIVGFIKNWVSISKRLKSLKKTNAEITQVLNTEFHLPVNFPLDTDEQIAIILHKILLPIIAHPIPAKKIYNCTACKNVLNIGFDIDYIQINMVENQFRFNQQLSNYFSDISSDRVCDKCHMLMSRQLKILDCPPVIILKISGMKPSTTLLSKPPNAVCFYPFLDQSCIACSSSTVFDIVCFLSVLSGATNKIVLATRIKQRWKISSMNKLIGNGETLGKLFANSRIVILERVRTCSTNFIYAFAQCCSISIDIEENSIGSCKTLRHAIHIIENNQIFNNLRNILLSHITTYDQCRKCYSTSTSLSSTRKCVCIYESETKNSVYAIPITIQNSIKFHCSHCNENYDDVILHTHFQTHHQYPSMIMYHLFRPTFGLAMDLHVELTDDTQQKHLYEPSSILLVDEYNAVSVIHIHELVVFSSSPYKTPIQYTKDEINELFDTSRTCIVFLKHTTTKTPSTSTTLTTAAVTTITTSSSTLTPTAAASLTLSTPTSILLKQPIAVNLLHSSTKKLTVGSVRSLTINRK
ncbi:unnamed protein product [Rotaria sp. Silwood2]|nr:unnamed protein product [Rotaria sp. Silwood2]